VIFDPLPNNNFSGKISYEPGGDYLSYMRDQCAQYGGLDTNSVRDTTSKIFANNFGLVKEYKCRGVSDSHNKTITAPSSSQINQEYKPPTAAENTQDIQTQELMPLKAPPVTERLSIELSKQKCEELGFKPATEGFGKCVLQLTK